MQRLYLLRHAKAAWGDADGDDFDRPLNKRGRAAAPAMGRFMAETGVAPTLILCSAAQRARETLALVLPCLREDCRIEIEFGLYLADAGVLLDRLRLVEDDGADIMVIGHNPGMQALALILATPTDAADSLAVRSKFPTAALAELAVAATRWPELTPGEGRLLRFVTPRQIAAAN